MTTGGATPKSTTGSPRFGGVSAHRRRANDVTVASTDSDEHQHPQQQQQENNNQNINDCIAEAAVDCFSSCTTTTTTTTTQNHHHNHNGNVLHRKGSVEVRNYGKLGRSLRRTLLGFLIVVVGFSVFVKFSYMTGGGGLVSEMEEATVSRSWSNAQMLMLRDYKGDVIKAQSVVADVDSFSMPNKILDKSPHNPVSLLF
ncbi:hypothetical protein Hanom_Chr04g00376761 [Helianthus anomalus]